MGVDTIFVPLVWICVHQVRIETKRRSVKPALFPSNLGAVPSQVRPSAALQNRTSSWRRRGIPPLPVRHGDRERRWRLGRQVENMTTRSPPPCAVMRHQSGTGAFGSDARHDTVRSSILASCSFAHSSKFPGRYDASLRQRSKTDTSIVSLIV